MTSFGSVFSAYLVKEFQIDNINSVGSLSMSIFYDENPQVYINGTLAWSASGWSSGYVSCTLDTDLLVAGTNTIAVYFCNPAGGGGAAMDLSLNNDSVLLKKASTWNYVTYEATVEVAALSQKLPLPEGWTTDLGLLTSDWFEDKTVTTVIDDEEKEISLSEVKNYRSGSAKAPFGGAYWNNGFVNTATDYQYYLGFMSTSFVLDDVNAVSKLYMDVIYDEDPIVYINGVEAWRTTGYKDGAYNTIDLTSVRHLLNNGENIVSVSWDNHYGGAIMDLSLYYEKNTAGDLMVIPSATGFYNFGSLNSPFNMIDGIDGNCCGYGFDSDADQAWMFTLKSETYVKEVYIQSKKENTTSDPDGRYGLFNVYALVNGEYQLCAEDVPAYVGDGNGMTVPVGVTTTEIKVVPTVWWGNNWANISVFRAYAGEKPEGNPADYDGDGVLGISDVTALLNYLSDNSFALAEGTTPDLDGNGVCDISDVTCLLNVLSNG